MGKVFNVMKEYEGDRPLDINDYIVRHPASTFFMEKDGDGPEGTDIKAGDVLVVDRSLSAKKGCVAVVAIDGELRVEKLSAKFDTEEASLWGVVTGLLRRL